MAKYLQYRLLTVSLILFAISNCYGQNGIIKGTVKGNESPVPYATVTLGSKTFLTDQKGEFQLSLPSGIYELIITHSGYQKLEKQIEVQNGQTLKFDLTLQSSGMLEEVVMIGTRSLFQRSNLNTPVPVNAYPLQYLIQTGQSNLTQMLQSSVPSFNASRQLVNESITLRGLDPDQVLILINGKRYHNMAFVNNGGVRGVLGRGAVANDLNSIPISAIERIEILSDGAAAQYGSDAIAGVINIILKETTGKTSIQMQAGQYYKGDGENINIGFNRGIGLKKKGVLNLSTNIRSQDPTYRGGEYRGTVYINNPQIDETIIQSRSFDRNKVSNAGTSKHNSYGFLLNGGHSIKKSSQLFWTLMFNNRKTVFLNPRTLPKTEARVNPEIYPDGFQAKPNHNSKDLHIVTGLKGQSKNRWSWEYSITIGNNTDRYRIKNSNNASQFVTLGKNAPTSFYTGTLAYSLLTNGVQLSKNLSSKSERVLNLGLGAEWRFENFRIKQGEEAAWEIYDPSGKKQGGAIGGLVFQPSNAVNKNRNVIGGYIDIEMELKNCLLFNVATRHEFYNDFGSNLAGKIAIRYRLFKNLSLRGSLSNGFRAPSLQQRYYSNTIKTLTNSNGILIPVNRGIFHNNSDVANAFGIPSLAAERSINLSGGLTSSFFKNINLTLDVYWIQIRNRIVLSGIFDTTNANAREILRTIPGIDQVQFFVNAVNTRTLGTDISINGTWKKNKATFLILLAANFNSTRLFGNIKTAGKLKPDSLNTNTLFNREERVRLEDGQPSDKIIFTLNYKTGKFGFLLRNTHFGKTAIAFAANNPTRDEFFSPKILTDCSISYTALSWFTIKVGANNIFNRYPDRIKNSLNTGEGIFIYSQEATPFGFNGGYYFVNLSFNF